MKRLTAVWLAVFLPLLACGGDSEPKKTKDTPAAKAAAKDDLAEGSKRARVRAADSPMAVGRVKTAEPPSDPVELTPSGELVEGLVKELVFQVPKEWEKRTPTSNMRKAEWDLPGPGGGASLVFYRFARGGGSADKNIDRWIGQMVQPDGSNSKEAAKIETSERDGLKFTTVDISGRYDAPARPGGARKHVVDDARLLTAMIEGVNPPYYLKLLGPRKTVDVWADAWTAMLASAKKTAVPQ